MEERRLILAFALSFAVLLGFRMWTNARYPQTAAVPAATPAAAPSEPAAAVPAGTPAPAATKAPPTVAAVPTAPVVTAEERRVELVTKDAEIAFSSKGARLLSWKLLEYRDVRGKQLEAHPGGNPAPGPLDLVTASPGINAKIREASFRATDIDGGGEKGIRFDYSDGTLVVSKTIRTLKSGRVFHIEADVREGGVVVPAQLYWGPGFGQATDEERSLQGYHPPQVVEIDEAGAEVRLPPASLAAPRTTRNHLIGVENKYFAVILTREDGGLIEATARASAPEPGKEAHVEILAPLPVALTIGAKDYDRLHDLGMGVEKIVPVGSWIGPIVVPLTRALRAVNARVGNYGLAIVLLTIAISLALAPLRHYAILSSAKMAKVAPQIRAVQERYKRLSLTDPKRQQMQQEIAEVYEKNGIDMVKQTAAGCLPTLLTMPFLFAFYRMLDISVDLKGSPFFWIPDLSLKDPLFITPVLSGLSMIAMQRLMPAPAVDPAQQRMMLLMPVIFSGMFAWAPAGLNLYWFISNLAAMAQQVLAMYFAPHLFPKTKTTAT
jgi:YidC/Oxa1 family membrane protein insertase